jgi:HSP20 family protein
MHIRDLIPWSRGGREVQARREGADDPMLALQSDINRVFESFWRSFDLPTLGNGGDGLVTGAMPRVDVRETDSEVEVVAEVPGMDEADLDVSIADGVLTVRGEKKTEREQEDKGYILRERSFGRIERRVPLPDGLDLDSAKATFKNGVLTVRMTKTPEAQAAVKRIQVQAA